MADQRGKSREMTITMARPAALIVCVCLCGSHAHAQSASNPTREQRELLHAVVLAVDAATAQSETLDAAWQMHVLRASDGSHYLAFTARPSTGMPLPAGPALLYVRLAHATPSRLGERSQIREWLAGTRTAPPPIARIGIAIGEMPVMGATGNIQRGTSTGQTPTTAGMVDLQLLTLEHRREKARQEEAERRRRAELEGKATAVADVVPFEDFDLASRSIGASGARVIARALTTGPGDYMLYLGWADPSAPKPASTIQVMKKSIRLPPASRDALTISSVILADGVRVRDTPYPASEQASHPYSIGVTEIAPAADAVFTSDENINIVFQVINPRPSEQGKPDVEIASRIVRLTGIKAEPIASLKPLTYSADTMPAPFDLRLGHPVFVALTAPLETLGRGSYRLEIIVNDRNAGRSATSDVEFTVAATAKSLLGEAPPLEIAFAKESVLHASARTYVVQSLTPSSPSPALRRALANAGAGQFVDLMVEEPVAKGEEAVRAALTGLAYLALGDESSAVQFQRAVLLGAPIGPARLLSGAARALQGRDADAIAAWREALTAGAPRDVVAPLLLDAYVRRRDYPAASAVIAETKQTPTDPGWARGVAATLIATRKEGDAITILDAHLATHADDSQARWLLLRALYAEAVAGRSRDRFSAEARRYIDGKGAHAALVADWLKAIS
jgi:hypothetical protein